MRLLRAKGIQMHRAQTQLNVEETTKSKLFAKHEMRKKRQTERHILRKEMAEHAIPRLFVSGSMAIQMASIVRFVAKIFLS